MFLNDKEISKLAENDLFTPYIGEKCRRLSDGTRAISYGLSQAGYDIRLSPNELMVFDGKSSQRAMLDPKLQEVVPYHATLIHGSHGAWFVLPPHSFGLGVSHELISMPNNVIGI